MDPTQTLRFTKIYLKNWRNFAEVEVALPRRAFLVGPNASGKTNFLDAFRFLAEIATPGSGGLVGAVKKRGEYTNLHRLSARSDAPMTIRATVGNDTEPQMWEYELTFMEEGKGELSIIEESVKRSSQQLFGREVLDSEVIGEGRYLQTTASQFPGYEGDLNQRNGRMARRLTRPLTQTYLESEEWRNLISDFADFLTSVRHFNVAPVLVRHSVTKDSNVNGYNDFIEQIADTPENEQGRKLGLIQEVLRGAVPQFKDLRLVHGTFDIPHLYARYANWKDKKKWEDETRFSDGTLRLIGLLWAMLDGSGPILVEEPELSLHYGILQFLPDVFARVSYVPGRQVIIATHSTDLLMSKGIELDEVLLLQPKASGTTIKPASSQSTIKLLTDNGYSLAWLVQSSTMPTDVDAVSYFPPMRDDMPEEEQA